MNETEGMRRFVEATERIAKALERMAEQQAEFLATMPAEEVVVPVEPESVTAAAPDPVFTHPYDATCACLACWTVRHKAKAE